MGSMKRMGVRKRSYVRCAICNRQQMVGAAALPLDVLVTSGWKDVGSTGKPTWLCPSHEVN